MIGERILRNVFCMRGAHCIISSPVLPILIPLNEAKRSSHTTNKKVCRYHIISAYMVTGGISIERYRVDTKLPSNIPAETLQAGKDLEESPETGDLAHMQS
jgi:hypothetical protein